MAIKILESIFLVCTTTVLGTLCVLILIGVYEQFLEDKIRYLRGKFQYKNPKWKYNWYYRELPGLKRYVVNNYVVFGDDWSSNYVYALNDCIAHKLLASAITRGDGLSGKYEIRRSY